jgi:basic amino acid/polyamine antiporter, APA family
MQEEELKRGFGLSTATYVVIASMIGTGILISPGYMMASLGNHWLILGLWLFGGLLAICGALCVAELAAALPKAGGEYVYLREAYGPMPAFLSGWSSFFLGFSAPLAVASYIAAKYLLTPFGLAENSDSNLLVKVLAAVIIIAITLPNLIGQSFSAWTQNLTTIIKIGLFVVLVVFAVLFGKGKLANFSEGRPIGDVDLATAASQLFYVMFAYSGWNAASYLAGEVKNPGKILPKSLLIGTGFVTVLYLAINLVFAYAIPIGDISFQSGNAEQVPQIAVANLFGGRVSSVFSVLLGFTFLATVSAFIITGPRIYYAMAKDGLFPAIAGYISGKGHIPVYAMAAQSVCAIIFIFVTPFQSLYKYASVGLSIFTLLFIGAVYVLRWKQPSLERPFRMPGYPVIPAIYMIAILFVTVFAFTQWKMPSIFSLASILVGIPVYYIWVLFCNKKNM